MYLASNRHGTEGRVQLNCDGTRLCTEGEVKGKCSQYSLHYLGTLYIQHYYRLMRTPRLPVVDWTDAPADLNGLVRFAERRNWFLRVCHYISNAVYNSWSVKLSTHLYLMAGAYPPCPYISQEQSFLGCRLRSCQYPVTISCLVATKSSRPSDMSACLPFACSCATHGCVLQCDYSKYTPRVSTRPCLLQACSTRVTSVLVT
jgi:hypothetical protein